MGWIKRLLQDRCERDGHAWVPYGYCVRCDEPHPAVRRPGVSDVEQRLERIENLLLDVVGLLIVAEGRLSASRSDQMFRNIIQRNRDAYPPQGDR